MSKLLALRTAPGFPRPIALPIQAMTMLNVPIVSHPQRVAVAAMDRIVAG
jgi:hypothetical protein